MENKQKYTWHYLSGYLGCTDESTYMKEAEGRYSVYSKADVFLPSSGVLAGNLDLALMNEVIVNRISRHFLQKEVYNAVMSSAEYKEQEKNELREMTEAFEPEVLSFRADAVYSNDELLAWESNLATSNHYNGHQVLDYKLLLAKGVGGLISDFKIKLSENAGKDHESEVFYKALIRAFEGVSVFIKRHADLALSLADQGCCSEEETARLKTIARLCSKIAEETPSGFAEGIAFLWFFVGFADYDSLGRFDQYLYPLYRQSIDSGMTRDEAKSLMKDFWLMLDRNGAIINMTCGGNNMDGSSAVNELTWLVLEVTRELKLKGPNLCLRLGENESDELWDTVHENLAAGQALPALYNEKEIVPMLVREGISEADAWDFCLAGCSQVVIPGKSSFACDIGTYNTLKCLELALHDGFDRRIGRQVGPHSGLPASFDSYEKVRNALSVQVDHAVRVGVSINNKDHDLRKDFCSCIRSALTSDCVEKGRHLFVGGARYYAVQNEVVGLTNTADSLLAIKKVVFGEKRLSLAELVEILDRNFAENEELRKYLINRVPKFGNGNEEADDLRIEITDEFFSKLASNKAPLGGRHWPGEVIFHYNTALGKTTLASPDGRSDGQPLADSSGPSQGADKNGVLGIFQSMSKMKFSSQEYPNTCSCLNLKFDLAFWKRAKKQITDLLKTYMKNGFQLQINVLNAKDLEEALIHPEAYSWLVVRVGGYSAYFTSLEPSIQRDIINRTTQKGL